MEKVSTPTFTFSAKAYCLLTKPGILFGNAVTTAGGFALAQQGQSIGLFLATMVGLSCVIASGCVLNNCIDREADAKMQRTKHRAEWFRSISAQSAIGFALLLGLIGLLCLFWFTNRLATATALFGFVVYVFLYTYSKYKSVHGTLIGSIAGAVPPVVGYTAASGVLDAGAWIFFAMMVLWQMPHFFAIAMYRREEYEAAGIPVFPAKRGEKETKWQMVGYIAAFTAACWLLVWFGYVGMGYGWMSTILGAVWFGLGVRGFGCADDKRWARQMFLCSLLVILGLSGGIMFLHRIWHFF